MAEAIKSTENGKAHGAQPDPSEQAGTLPPASTVSITTDERVVRIEQMLESLLAPQRDTGTGSNNARTDAIYAEIERIRQSMSTRREQGKVNSQRIIDNLARFDVIAGGRF